MALSKKVVTKVVKKVAKKAAHAKKSTRLTRSALAKMMMPPAEIIKLMSRGTPGLKPPVLGHPKAIVIVCAAANTGPGNLPRTLSQLGVNGIAFQKSVFNGVGQAGYAIHINQIPDSPSTTLISAVTVIQNAKAT